MVEMAGLEDKFRIILERNIDALLKEPQDTQIGSAQILYDMGIQPDLETILSYITGSLKGVVEMAIIDSYGRTPNEEERKDIMELLKRRASELRDAFQSAIKEV
jgi:hypothetical protein